MRVEELLMYRLNLIVFAIVRLVLEEAEARVTERLSQTPRRSRPAEAAVRMAFEEVRKMYEANERRSNSY
jgi:hypothetical protein